MMIGKYAKTRLAWGSLALSFLLWAGPAAKAAPPRGDNPEPAASEMAADYEEGIGGDHAYCLHLSQDGLLAGKLYRLDSAKNSLVPAQGARVRFVQEGKVVAVCEPRVNGVFQASGIVPGTYTVLADGPDGLAVVSVDVLPRTAWEGPESEMLEILLASPADIPAIQEIAARELPGLAAMAPMPRPAEVKVPANLVGLPPKGSFLPNAEQVALAAEMETLSGTPILELTGDGEAHGRAIHFDRTANGPAPVESLTLYFLRSGGVVSEAAVQGDGSFRVRGLDPGVYTLVAAGPTGFAVLTIQAVAIPVGTAETIRSSQNKLIASAAGEQIGEQYVALFQPAPQPDLTVPIAPPGDVQPLFAGGAPGFPPGGPGFGAPAPMAAGGMGGAGGGFGGGGGGLFGGGGLLGGLIGAGVGAGIAAAVSDNDENSGGPGQPASPFIPSPAPSFTPGPPTP